jgi:hypothetical protein
VGTTQQLAQSYHGSLHAQLECLHAPRKI